MNEYCLQHNANKLLLKIQAKIQKKCVVCIAYPPILDFWMIQMSEKMSQTGILTIVSLKYKILKGGIVSYLLIEETLLLAL